MGLFRKKKDVVDFTRLQKQGILDKVKTEKTSTESSGFMDLGSSSNTTNDEGASALSALSSLASAGTSESSEISTFSTPSYTDRLKRARIESKQENEVKNKLDDMEYKMDRILERLAKLEDQSN
jgi:hypothetical protein